MSSHPLRVAIFSGNYNYVRDGANQALNRLVGYLLRQSVKVRIYSPTTATPDFPPTGDLVSVASIPLPFGRGEYRLARGLTRAARRDLAAFNPHIVHVAAPDILGHRAISWARQRRVPVLASMHTRFETYPRYYGLAFLEPLLMAMLRRFYQRCDAVVAPSPSMAKVMHDQKMGNRIDIWARGIDTEIFNPTRRSLPWRQSLGIGDADVVIGFLGRLVMEKGLDIFADTMAELRRRKVRHRVLVIGDGPAREWFENNLPEAVFVGFQAGADLGRAVASMDMLFNPSITETFGNVTLETMACAVPVIAARATGSENLVVDGVTGRLVTPGDVAAFADALSAYCSDPGLRTAHGQAGQKASTTYDWDRVNQSVLDQYWRLTGRADG